jgi:hypothetical protein
MGNDNVRARALKRCGNRRIEHRVACPIDPWLTDGLQGEAHDRTHLFNDGAKTMACFVADEIQPLPIETVVQRYDIFEAHRRDRLFVNWLAKQWKVFGHRRLSDRIKVIRMQMGNDHKLDV